MFVIMLFLFVTVCGVYCCSVRIVVQANIIRLGFSSGYNVSSSGGRGPHAGGILPPG